MACDECQYLRSHEFASADDLINAVRGAAQEMDRGVIARDDPPQRGAAAQESLESMFASGALPETLNYRFRCTTCGDRFTLQADTRDGSGAWLREGEKP
jgi:hypothetical protein